MHSRLVKMHILGSNATFSNSSGDAVDFEIPNLIRTYRSGRVERLQRANFVPPDVAHIATGVSSKDITYDPSLGLSSRLYRPPASIVLQRRKLPLLFYIHGGAFCTGSPFSSIYHKYLNSIVSNAGILAVSVAYRLAPEHPLPAAYEDSWKALSWALACADDCLFKEPWLADLADLDKVFIVGDSAGANIAHYLGMRLGEEGRKVEGLALLHPFFWDQEKMKSEGKDRGEVLFNAMNIINQFWSLICPGSTSGLDDPRLNPTAEGAPSLGRLGCRRVLVCVAGMDLLRERGIAYYEKLVGSRWVGEAELFESVGKDHTFHLTQRREQKTLELMHRLVSFIHLESNHYREIIR